MADRSHVRARTLREVDYACEYTRVTQRNENELLIYILLSFIYYCYYTLHALHMPCIEFNVVMKREEVIKWIK